MAPKESGKRIFMTGATGYIGSVVTEFAIAEGFGSGVYPDLRRAIPS